MTEKIRVLSEIDHIRQRTGMYIGLTNNPLHLCYELIDNALDEANGGHADRIQIDITRDLFIIKDNGRGIPLHDLNGETAAIVTCSKLFSGGKFDKHAYKISIGLNGVGLVAVNALSKLMTLHVERDNQQLTAFFSKGELKSKSLLYKKSKITGTEINFQADPEIFESTNLEPLIPIIEKRLRLAKTALECNIMFQGNEVKPYTNEELIKCSVLVSKKSKTNELMVLGYKLESTVEDLNNGAVNLLPVDRGTHIQALRKIIQEAWSPFVNGRNIKPADVLIGCSGFISVIVDEPKYSSQTKEQLSSSNPVRPETYGEFVDEIRNYLINNEGQRNILLRKFEDYRASLDRLSSTAYINSVIKLGELDGDNVSRNSSVPKLLDCSSPKRDSTELYIVEGASAKGPLKSTRNSSIHAILPLKGKILNVIDRDIVSIMDNDEVRSIINGIGCFTKDTKVSLMNGTEVSFEDLVKNYSDKQFWVYSYDKDNDRIVPGLAHSPRITRQNSKLVRVSLDNSETIRCTPDHLFMLRDGTYKEAQYLKPEDSLMPLYREKKPLYNKVDYECIIHNQQETWTHQISNLTNTGNCEICGVELPDKKHFLRHHKDFNRFNNDPDNIQFVTWSEHGKIHFTTAKRMHQSPNFLPAVIKTIKAWNNSEKGKAQFERLKELSRGPKHLNRMSELAKSHNKDPKVIKKREERRVLNGTTDIPIHKRWHSNRNQYNPDCVHCILDHPMNHKVVSVELLNEQEDVYDLTVDKYHNFALSSGVFVHNCGAYSKFDITRIRYGKIIIMTDADQDGLNILALLIGLFNYAMPELISAGHLYYAEMPLYGYYNKKFIPVYNEKDLPPKIKSYQRFKGLGEMNPDQIKEIAFNDQIRRLIQVTDPDKEVTKLVGGSFLKRKLLVDNGILLK